MSIQLKIDHFGSFELETPTNEMHLAASTFRLFLIIHFEAEMRLR